MKYALVLALLLSVGICHAQPVITLGDAEPSVGNVTSYSTESFAISGSDLLLVACVWSERPINDQTVTAVDWNTSESLTKLIDIGTETGDNFDLSFWYLVAPTATTSTVDVTITEASTVITHAFYLTNAKQSAPVLNNSHTCDACTLSTADLTTTAAETLLLTCVGTDDSGTTWTHGTGQTELTDLANTSGSFTASATSYEVRSATGTETLTSTASGTENLEYIVMGVEPVPASATRRRMPSWVLP